MPYTTDLLSTEFVTHDVKRFLVRRPEGFSFEPGQGVELSTDVPAWRSESRPFTPTLLPHDRVLEFTIKRYPERDGVTDLLHTLQPGARLHLTEPFGTIRDRGPGTFLAGGAGVTPFLAIVRERLADGGLDGHSMIFSNKKRADVICEKELRHAFGERLSLLLTRQQAPGYDSGRIDRERLEREIDDFDQTFYICGPPDFVTDVRAAVEDLGADPERIVVEE